VVVEIRFKDFTDDALGYVKFIYDSMLHSSMCDVVLHKRLQVFY
jgi:hypothetical protein